MIVESLIKDMIWTLTEVKCPDNLTGKIIYSFLYELILDSHLYVTKPIGCYIENKTQRNKAGTYIARNIQIGESYAELMTNLQDKVFTDTVEPVVKFDMKAGIVDCSSIPTKVLRVKDYICRITDGECQMQLKLCTGCGEMNLKETSERLDPKFFPMNTYFNIMDYVRILPKVDHFENIQLRFYNGMDIEILKSMLIRYMGMIKQESISEEETAWVYSFDL